VPFQRSTRAWVPPSAVLSPTAVQATGVLHATPSRAAKIDPGGFGVRTIRQALPFHRPARLAPRPEVLTCTPTAMHEFDPVHDTQNSCPVGICGLGVGVTDQPGTGAPADAAFADPAAPTAGPSNTTAAPTATAARRIRPRIATPLPAETHAASGRGGARINRGSSTHARRRCAEDLELPCPLRADPATGLTRSSRITGRFPQVARELPVLPAGTDRWRVAAGSMVSDSRSPATARKGRRRRGGRERDTRAPRNDSRVLPPMSGAG
jgi:hypothetical protein